MMTADIVLSSDQAKAKDAVLSLLSKERVVTLAGYAGTGKTTLISALVPALRDRFEQIVFCAYTGKAKTILEEKLKEGRVLEDEDEVRTLHSFLYRPRFTLEFDKATGTKSLIPGWERKERSEATLVIVDEASMVNEEIYKDLLKQGVPILAVGDHGQLPPVSGEFNLMQDPMVRLEKIHRQAEGDPIIQVSILAREQGHIPLGEYGDSVRKTDRFQTIDEITNPLDWMHIAGTNRLRCNINQLIRGKMGYAENTPPHCGERVICLKNNHALQVFNGMMGTLDRIELYSTQKGPHYYDVDIQLETHQYSGIISKYQFGQPKTLNCSVDDVYDQEIGHKELLSPTAFGDLWDFGYCLTAWKAQGSEADNVVVFEEKGMRAFMQHKQEDGWRRFLYTAVTRSKKKLLIIELN